MQQQTATRLRQHLARTLCGLAVAGAVLSITACGGGGGGGGGGSSGGGGTPQQHVGGWVAGLNGSVVLTLNGVSAGTVSANGTFQLSTPVAQGASYTVGVQTQPSGGSCTVWQGTGTVGTADVSNVFVRCASQTARYAFIATDPDPALGSSDSGYVAAYAVDPARGALRLVKRTAIASAVAGTANARWVGNIAVDPNGRFAYIADTLNGNLLPFSIGVDGSLTPISGAAPAPIGDVRLDTVQFTIDPSGRYVYAVNNSVGLTNSVPANTISQFAIGASGTLSPIAGAATVPTGVAPVDIAVDPSGRYAYVANLTDNTVSQYLVGANGALTPNPAAATVATSGPPSSITIDPAGHFAYVLNNQQSNAVTGTIDQFSIGANGGLVPISGAPSVPTTGPGAGSIAIDSTGTHVYAQLPLLGYDQYAVASNGALVPNAVSATFAATVALQVKELVPDPSGRFLFAFGSATAGGGKWPVAQFVIQSDGTLAAAPALGATSGPTIKGFAFAAGTPVQVTAEHAYLANRFSNSVAQFAINASTGALAADTPATVAAGVQPAMLSVDPAGRFAYAIAGDAAYWNIVTPGNPGTVGNDSIAQYTLGADGSLTANAVAATVAGGGGPLVLGTDGTLAYQVSASAGTLNVFRALDNGTLSAVTTTATGQALATPATPVGLALHPSGWFAFVVNNGQQTVQLFKFDANPTVAPSLVTTLPTGSSPVAVAVHPSGAYAYVANVGDGTVSQYVFNAGNGTLTTNAAGATASAGTQPVSIAIHPTGKYAYVANAGDNTLSQYTVGANGVLTAISGAATVATRPQPLSVTVDALGKYVYVSCFGNNTLEQYTIGANGALTLNAAAPVVVTGASPAGITTTATWQ